MLNGYPKALIELKKLNPSIANLRLNSPAAITIINQLLEKHSLQSIDIDKVIGNALTDLETKLKGDENERLQESVNVGQVEIDA